MNSADSAERKLQLFQLRQHIKSLKEWKRLYDRDLDFYEREMLNAATESVRTASAIKELEEKVKELENEKV